MGAPIRSRLLDYVEAEPPADAVPVSSATPEPRRSRLLDYAENVRAPEPPARPAAPEPGVPAYHTPVFVPAHPRYVTTPAPSDATTPSRVPFITYELFEHPTDGTVALAFTTLHALVAALGEAQPWVVTSLGPLAEGVREQGVTVRLDPRIAAGRPNWRPADLSSYAREVR
ncbi:SAV_915 family protein [Streptomyces sp. NPDC013178]|uniref:SAV_915 family protein n=1 Tax=unclassified Streptomyces TaxID=2593676 RepID=UPI003411867D